MGLEQFLRPLVIEIGKTSAALVLSFDQFIQTVDDRPVLASGVIANRPLGILGIDVSRAFSAVFAEIKIVHNLCEPFESGAGDDFPVRDADVLEGIQATLPVLPSTTTRTWKIL